MTASVPLFPVIYQPGPQPRSDEDFARAVERVAIALHYGDRQLNQAGPYHALPVDSPTRKSLHARAALALHLGDHDTLDRALENVAVDLHLMQGVDLATARCYAATAIGAWLATMTRGGR